ncbi:MAG TPA: sigma-70 family RNA polymerase sigma factor [Anaerolineales bacterium]|nr:sigma-70 family RNA polymerase sigma factor [Anaerolineales bacterium]
MADHGEKAFEDQFHENWERVNSLLFRLVGDPAEADDLALEVFWRLHQTPPREREDSQIRAWLYRVATNLGYNHLRSRRRRQHYESLGGSLDLNSRESVDPAHEALRREEHARVQGVFRELKRGQAQIIALRYSGLSYAEIAAALQISPSSVGQLLARAEAEFEKQYRKLEETDGPSE